VPPANEHTILFVDSPGETNMIIIDKALREDQRREVLDDTSFFPGVMGEGQKIATEVNSYHYEKSDCYAPFMFWDGWWRSPANTVKKKTIMALWHGRIPYPLEDVLGIEYWTRTYSPGQYLDLHVDEDTFLYERTKIFRGPAIGGVYYGCDNENGGFLEIHKKELADNTENALENMSQKGSPIEERERIAYKGNRLIIFDAGHVVHSSVGSTSGVRQVMVSNIWHKDCPPTALELGEFYYE